MTKTLLDKQLEEANREAAESSGMPYGARGGDGASLMDGRTTPAPDLSSEELKAGANKRPWSEDPTKRIAIRMLSRGVLGSAFFIVGGQLAKKWLDGELRQSAYNPHAHWGDVLPFTREGNVGKFMSKLIDTVAGKPIEWTVRAVTGSEVAAMKAVRFRPTANQGYGEAISEIGGNSVRGRSLGHETFSVTWDFFLMSIGDALGRDIAGWFDPAVEKKWLKNGNIVVPEAIKSMAKSAFYYTTYNGGEDWAVSIPYVYFMKGQRAWLNRRSPGSGLDFDNGLNGGSHKLKNGTIIGTYAQESAFDFQTRFTVYNIGTLMYREVYNYLENKWNGHEARLYGSPEDHTERGVTGTLADLGKWVARSAIKGAIYMTPAVPFFTFTRVHQNKHKGLLIDSEHGYMAVENNGQSVPVRVEDSYKTETSSGGYLQGATPVHYERFDDPYLSGPVRSGLKGRNAAINPTYADLNPEGISNTFHPYGSYGHNVNKTVAEKIGARIGGINYQIGELFDPPAQWADRNLPGLGNPIKRWLGLGANSWDKFTHPMVNASLSYTPYMIAKTEAANLWDDGKMDVAAERLIDGAARLNWGEFKAGIGEVCRAFLHQPFSDPRREAIAQRRKQLDQSPSDAISPHWRERIITGKAPDSRKEGFSNPYKSDGISRREVSYAEQEERSRVLAEARPPTSSIN